MDGLLGGTHQREGTSMRRYSPAAAGTSLRLQGLSKNFENTRAVVDVDLEVREGEFYSIVGPSGSGKTTLLRLIAGFEKPSSGRIYLGENDITEYPPQGRSMAMVFQNYALFPHMTVWQNVAFGLQAHRVPRPDVHRRVADVLDLVQLNRKASDPVTQLSGGEQQRAAVARALVVEPAVLLMDEPLSNLDVSLRLETREQLRLLQQRIGITTLYVTHDQSEALGLSDRIAVMSGGELIQKGTPRDVYGNPRSLFVASFLGNANMISGTVVRKQRRSVEVAAQKGLKFSVPYEGGLSKGESVIVAVKPEHITIVRGSRSGMFSAKVVSVQFQGMFTEYLLQSQGNVLRVLQTGKDSPVRVGSTVSVDVDSSKCSVFKA